MWQDMTRRLGQRRSFPWHGGRDKRRFDTTGGCFQATQEPPPLYHLRCETEALFSSHYGHLAHAYPSKMVHFKLHWFYININPPTENNADTSPSLLPKCHMQTNSLRGCRLQLMASFGLSASSNTDVTKWETSFSIWWRTLSHVLMWREGDLVSQVWDFWPGEWLHCVNLTLVRWETHSVTDQLNTIWTVYGSHMRVHKLEKKKTPLEY